MCCTSCLAWNQKPSIFVAGFMTATQEPILIKTQEKSAETPAGGGPPAPAQEERTRPPPGSGESSIAISLWAGILVFSCVLRRKSGILLYLNMQRI